MTNPESKTGVTDAVQETAIQWHVLLSGGAASENDWMDFTRWLEEDPKHNEAYDLVALSWESAAEYQVDSQPVSNKSPTDILGALWNRAGKLLDTQPWAFSGGIGVAVAAMIMVLLAPVLLENNNPSSPLIYATAIGEQRTVTLEDGSTVLLNTATTISVNITAKSRNIELKQGEAFFTVQHENNRLFEVRANGLRITDLGTSFDVRALGAKTQISVVDGIVEVEKQLSNDNQAPVRLIAGQQATHSNDLGMQVKSFDVSKTTAWQRGNLVFNNDTLSTVIAEINRYFPKPLRLIGDDLHNMPFSGIIQISDQRRMVHDLTALLSLDAYETDAEIILTKQIGT